MYSFVCKYIKCGCYDIVKRWPGQWTSSSHFVPMLPLDYVLLTIVIAAKQLHEQLYFALLSEHNIVCVCRPDETLFCRYETIYML